MKRTILFAFFVLLVGLFAVEAVADEVAVFGPHRYLRTEGAKDIFTDEFSAAQGEGALIVKNGNYSGDRRIEDSVSSATVIVNGEQILGPNDFNKYSYLLEASVNLNEVNTLVVELASKPESYITVEVTEEIDLPTVDIRAEPESILEGESAALFWNSTNCQCVTIDQGIGDIDLCGSITVSPAVTTVYTITAAGLAGTATDQVVITVTGGGVALQPEGSFGQRYEDLIPPDATAESYDPRRFSVITGLVYSADDAPLSDVSVTILNHPEYGTAFTDSNGLFSVPVEGGGTITVVYQKPGLLSFQRKVDVPWNDIAVTETIWMISEDPASTVITFNGSPDTVITHRGSEVTDEFGSRSCSMVFTGDNQAYEIDAGGTVIGELATITSRATEYNTEKSMPARLPPTSAYTYCVELGVDGVQRVNFEKPVITWVENFLGFDVGEIVPVGYYDRDKGVWIPSENGVVVRLLDRNSDGIVDALDADGDNGADDINGNGSFDDEVIGLEDSLQYVPNATFWRVELSHFSAWDFNWPYGPSPGATQPNAPTKPHGKSEEKPCFVEGTPVKTEMGFRPIEEIKEGDMVFSRDENASDIVGREVIRTFTTQDQVVYELSFTDSDGRKEIVGTTAEHPFWVKDRGWIAAGELVPGDKISTIDGDGVTFNARRQLPEKTVVYNIEVEDLHTYFVGRNGFWVHNTCARDIDPRKRSLDVDVPIPGTDMNLHYASDRVGGYRSVITVPASGDTVPSVLKEILVKVTVSGRVFEQTLEPLPNQNAVFIWDGLDMLGRTVEDFSIAHVAVGFVYDAVYYSASQDFEESFANAGTDVTSIRSRKEIIFWKHDDLKIRRGRGTIADGWTLSTHHQINSGDNATLDKGDGTRITREIDIIRTIAGNGTWGYSGDGGVATEAEIASVSGVTVDAAGNLYVSDSDHNVIRKVDSAGVITTIAGNGTEGYDGDGGPAIQAQLDYPSALAADDAGNLYIVDSGNNCVRKIDKNGIIFTVAGNGTEGFSGDNGLAVDGQLNYPEGIAVDAAGNLYIADTYNQRIRKVDPNGIITTVAGDGMNGFGGDEGFATEAQLSYPRGIAIDQKGNLYIVDEWNCRVRKVDTAGVITTVAGNGIENYFGDGGVATNAALGYPFDVSVDLVGNIYILVQEFHCVRKVDSSGIITTVTGSENGLMGGYSGDGGPAAKAALSWPTGIDLDPAGNLYIADSFNYRIRRVENLSFHSADAAIDCIMYPEDEVGYVVDTGIHRETIDLDTGVVVREFGYDQDRKLVSISDQFGNRIMVERDVDGVPIAIISPDGITTDLMINSDNHLTSINCPDGSYYSFEYTPEGLMTAKTEPEGNRFEYTFDLPGRLTDMTDQEGGHWQFSEDGSENGAVLYTERTIEDNTTSYLDHIYSTGRYTCLISDPAGETIDYARTADGFAVHKAYSCGIDLDFSYALDRQYNYKYVKTMTERAPSGLLRETLRDRIYQDNDDDTSPDLISEMFTINGKTLTIEHDVLQSQKSISSPEGRTVTNRYNPANLLVESLNIPNLYEMNYGYDTRGRLTSLSTGTRTTYFVYNAEGFLASITDPAGFTTTYDYDPVGRVIAAHRPDGSSLWHTYDGNGNMEVLTTPSDVDHIFSYNTVNSNDYYQTPLSGGYSYVYDRDRRLIRTNYPSGAQINNIYDKTRLVQIRTPEGTIDYNYLCGTKVGSITDGTDTVVYDYDGTLITREALSGTIDQTLSYIYNSDFAMNNFAYAGATEAYRYDNDGLLIGSGRFTISRNLDNGLPESVTDSNMVLDRSFNGYGEVDRESYGVAGSGIVAWDVIRDDNGRITDKTEMIGGSTEDFSYTYDSLGRLLTVTKESILIEEYQYGDNGARIYEMNNLRGIAGRNLVYSEEDHLLTAGTATYQYDLDGFLTTKTDEGEETFYDYSTRGELLGVTLPDGTTIDYDHDPLGRRIAKRVNGTITEKYLWQGLTRLLAVYDGNDNLMMRFEYADGRMPYAMTEGGLSYYLTYDQVGSLRIIADASGNVVKRIDYDSFGNIITDSNSAFDVPFGFAGGLFDKDTGLIRFGYRDYDPDVGRWTAKDPILFAGGDTDLYGYCLNDPVNWVDTIGLWGIEIGGSLMGFDFTTNIYDSNKGWFTSTETDIGISTTAFGGGIHIIFDDPCDLPSANDSDLMVILGLGKYLGFSYSPDFTKKSINLGLSLGLPYISFSTSIENFATSVGKGIEKVFN